MQGRVQVKDRKTREQTWISREWVPSSEQCDTDTTFLAGESYTPLSHQMPKIKYQKNNQSVPRSSKKYQKALGHRVHSENSRRESFTSLGGFTARFQMHCNLTVSCTLHCGAFLHSVVPLLYICTFHCATFLHCCTFANQLKPGPNSPALFFAVWLMHWETM